MASLFDIDDKNIINPINLIDNGWIYEGISYDPLHPIYMDYDWVKMTKLNLGNGYYCYCEFLFNSKTKKIHSSATHRTSTISNMNAINHFIAVSLKHRSEHFRSDYEYE